MPFAGGDGSQSNPYQIETWEHFDSIRDNLGDYFVLNNNLSRETEGYDQYASATANGGDGFIPISPLGFSTSFSGNFDGQGNEIADIVIDRRDKSQERTTGIFSTVTGVIKNTDFRNITVKVNSSEDTHGLLIGGDGTSGYTLTDCFISGQLIQEGSGGRLGALGQSFNTSVMLSQCLTVVTVHAPSANEVGGFIGYHSGGDISECGASGEVNGNELVAGFAGQIWDPAVIENSFTVTDVKASDRGAGFAGEFLNDSEASLCYAAGSVEVNGSTEAGFTITYNTFVTIIQNCYWDTEATGQSVGVAEEADDGVTGLTTSEMQGSSASSNLNAFDFTSVWRTVVQGDSFGTLNVLDGYPILQNVDGEAQVIAQDAAYVDKGIRVWTGTQWVSIV